MSDYQLINVTVGRKIVFMKEKKRTPGVYIKCESPT